MLLADKQRLLQIITNLVSNALKFTSEGTITVRGAVEQQIGTAVRLRFEVSDTGIGIPAAQQDLIFDAFTQADSSMTRRYGGTGLGLSLARLLCHMMDGDIGVQSVAGAGSTFWFTVLLERQPPCRTRRPASAGRETAPLRAWSSETSAVVSPASRDFRAALERVGRSSVSILLVEDNPANMRVTQALLETLGCRVTVARNGLEAVGIYRENRFDIVLMDCQMPEMDGYEATRAIRQIEGFQGWRTPMIALTAHAMKGSREASLESGMDDQITKPLTMAALTGKLLEWLVPTEAPPS